MTTKINFQPVDFSAFKTGPELLAAYNDMVATADDLLKPNNFSTTKRFSSLAAGIERANKLQGQIQAKIAEMNGDAPAETEQTNTDQSQTATGGDETGATAPAETTEGQTAAPSDEDDDMAKKAKKAAAKRGAKAAKPRKAKAPGSGAGKRVKSTDGSTIREKTDTYNAMVKELSAEVRKSIPFAKHHTSLFESQDKADKAIARLKVAIKKA